MTTILLTQTPPQASWWILAPWLLLAGAAAAIGVLGSRKGRS